MRELVAGPDWPAAIVTTVQAAIATDKYTETEVNCKQHNIDWFIDPVI